MIYMIN